MARLVELHTHLEGSVTPSRLVELAERHGQPTVPTACLTADGSRFRPPASFPDFLRIYQAITAVIRTPADHRALALDLARALADDEVVYCEATVSYGVLQRRGLDPLPVQQALHEAAAEARERHGLEIRWLPDAVRQFGPDAAARVLEVAAAAGRGLGVVGFGVGGDETAIPATEFAGVCGAAREAGLGVTIHAGETGGPDAVRDAVLACGATRIGHGIGAVLGEVTGWGEGARRPAAARTAPEAEDVEATLALLATRGILVELCPGSNVVTGVLPDLAAHPLRTFIARGIPCCLNTDDRSLFGLDLRGEYERAAATHALTPAGVAAMQRQALAASFADGATRDGITAAWPALAPDSETR
jgi:aminodeoxyfutalosine deaminase